MASQTTLDEQTRAVYKQLLAAAREARKNTYSPYSRHAVGSAVLCKDGTIVSACNVENLNPQSAICGERSAIVSAFARGLKDFHAIATIGNLPECYPCGACRQFLTEFDQGLIVVVERPDGEPQTCLLKDLTPEMPRRKI